MVLGCFNQIDYCKLCILRIGSLEKFLKSKKIKKVASISLEDLSLEIFKLYINRNMEIVMIINDE